MTEEEFRSAVDAALTKDAGPADAGWNRRFVAAVQARGLALIAGDRPPGNVPDELWLMAPYPYEQADEPYPYPCMIVPGDWETATE